MYYPSFVLVHAMCMDFGLPSSNIRFKIRTAMVLVRRQPLAVMHGLPPSFLELARAC